MGIGLPGPGRPARRFPLGDFPAIGVREAREAARTTRNAVRAGADPVADRRKRRAQMEAARLGEGTLRAMMDAYGRDAGAALRSWPHARRCVERVFSGLLDRPLAMLTVASLLLMADAYPAKTSPAYAVRTLRPVLKWASHRGYLSLDTLAFTRKTAVRPRERLLDRDELARLLPVLNASERPHAPAMLFMLLTLARREEVCGALWSHVDLPAKVWTIPSEHAKNKVAHQVPLSSQAAELLTRLRTNATTSQDLVFSVKGRGDSDAWDRRSPLGNWHRETKAIQKASKTKGWHRHDLRRTGATMLGELGEMPEIIEAALNHVVLRSTLATTYNRSRYRPAVATALQRLADELDVLQVVRSEISPARISTAAAFG
jgi:integrase